MIGDRPPFVVLFNSKSIDRLKQEYIILVGSRQYPNEML